MSSTYFETEGSPSRGRLYKYIFTFIGISRTVGRRLSSISKKLLRLIHVWAG